MATPFDSPDRPSDDSLSLFGAESPEAPRTSTGPMARPGAQERAIKTSSQPASTGAVGFDQLRTAGGVGFVEGVAAVQALCAALEAGPGAPGVPDIKDVFLTASGGVVANGPATGDSPPRELARILNQLVSPDSMPPAARLFVGRWSSSDSASLAEFATELEYFARPNGHDLLAVVYRQFESAASLAPASSPERRIPIPERQNPAPKPPQSVEEKRDAAEAIRRWLKQHRSEVVAAVAVISAALVTGVVVWMWPVMTPVVAKQLEKVGLRTSASDDGQPQNPATADKSSESKRTSTRSKAPTSRTRSQNARGLTEDRLHAETNAASADSQQVDAAVVPSGVEAPILPSTAVRDLRIYSAGDAGVQPPQLRSAGIPEMLLRGFERRTNAVELIISENGDVQQARMLNEPQRMPDIMVLSRVKELRFEPAVRNGVAVRYKLVLTWDVTP